MNSDSLPHADSIKAQFNTSFSQVVIQRMSLQDIRELIIDDLTPENPIEYCFPPKMEEEKIIEVMKQLEKNGFEVEILDTHSIKIFLR